MNRLFTIMISLSYLVSCEKQDTTICDLYEKQSAYANTTVNLKNVRVLKCSGLFSLSYAEVSDGECTMALFTTKPYTQNEIVNISTGYKVLYNHNGDSFSALVTEDFPVTPERILRFLL